LNNYSLNHRKILNNIDTASNNLFLAEGAKEQSDS